MFPIPTPDSRTSWWLRKHRLSNPRVQDKGPKRRGRNVGAKSFSANEKSYLLGLVEALSPIGYDDWEKIAALHTNKQFPSRTGPVYPRNSPALRRQLVEMTRKSKWPRQGSSRRFYRRVLMSSPLGIEFNQTTVTSPASLDDVDDFSDPISHHSDSPAPTQLQQSDATPSNAKRSKSVSSVLTEGFLLLSNP